MQLEIAVLGNSLEVSVEREQGTGQGNGVHGDQAVRGRRGQSGPATLAGQGSGPTMQPTISQHHGKAACEACQPAEVSLGSGTGENFLQDDARYGERRVTLDEPS